MTLSETPWVSQLNFAWRLSRRHWRYLLLFILAGIAISALVCALITPRYRSMLSFFTWNQSLGKAVAEAQDDNPENQAKAVVLYNNIIAQSMNIGQRLIGDYRKIINSDKVKKMIQADLAARGFRPPYHYDLKTQADRQSCIMTLEVTSPDRELAYAAAEAAMVAFTAVQKDLMSVYFAEKIDDATRPLTPYTPRWPLGLGLGAFFGALIGFGVIWLKEYLDMTIKAPDDLQEIELLPLGIIPTVDNLAVRLAERDLDGSSRLLTAMLDNYRIIKTTICYLNADHPPRLIQITSDIPSVGKSTSILLLAKVLGEDNQRVLVVDCDLRKPSLKNKLNLNCKNGLVDCIFNRKPGDDLAEFVEKDVFPHVDIIHHGVIPPAPTQLLNSERFAALLAELKQQYDYILLDSPPIQGMADAMILANLVDGVIIAAQAGRTRRDHLSRVMVQMGVLKNKFLGGVITNVSDKFNKYYYSYGYGYGYGYGSGEEEENA